MKKYLVSAGIIASVSMLANRASGSGYIRSVSGSTQSRAYAISANGKTLVGRAKHLGVWEPFKWSEIGGLVWLGDLPGGDDASQAWADSVDGSAVVGEQHGTGIKEAFRWSVSKGTELLGFLPGESWSVASSVSDDGSIVVGYGPSKAFRWTRITGMSELPKLVGPDTTGAFGISGDGSTIVGQSQGLAVRWMGNQSAQPLDAVQSAAAFAASHNGSVIAGNRYAGFDDQAFRWTPSEGMVLLGHSFGGQSYANAISSDGRYVAGSDTKDGPFIWDKQHGRCTLAKFFQDSGVSTSAWTSFIAVWGIQNVGGVVYVAGYGTLVNDPGPEKAFLAVVVPKPGDNASIPPP